MNKLKFFIHFSKKISFENIVYSKVISDHFFTNSIKYIFLCSILPIYLLITEVSSNKYKLLQLFIYN